MNIQAVRVYEGRNVHCHRPVIELTVDLGKYEELPTHLLPGFTERLLVHLPSLREHGCSTGEAGEFVKRLIDGTYLGHVLEHVALELQALVGFPVKYGKTRGTGEKGIYQVVFSYINRSVGLRAAEIARELILAATLGVGYDLAARLLELKELARKTELGPSTRALYEAAKIRGIPVQRVGESSLLQLGLGKYQKWVEATITSQTSCVAVDIACDKVLTKRLLYQAGMPVPRGDVAFTVEEALVVAERIGQPVVVKPYNSNQGKGVSVYLTTPEEVRFAFRYAQNYSDQIIVEENIAGKQYRILVVDGKMVAASERIPAHVIGDGHHTVQELVDIENQNPLRGDDHDLPLTRIQIDENVEMVLNRQRKTLQSVPRKGEKVFLRETSNLSTGGIAIDVTDEVHPKTRDMAIRAAQVIGLDVAGVDIIVDDIRNPLNFDNGAIIEVNAAPGIRMHYYPVKGEPRDAAGAIIDYLYPADAPRTIPIYAVTGTNGKTTTARLIAQILRAKGRVTGLSSTDGVYVEDVCLHTGDNTGPQSARMVLYDPRVEAAVLETARGGIVRGGLGYDLADVAVVTNITEDHLGQDGISDLKDLYHIKSLVAEAVKPHGAVVLNADNPWTVRMAERVRCSIIYFSALPDSPILRRHLGIGGEGVFLQGGNIVWAKGNRTEKVIAVHEIPITLNGFAKHNVENALAATAAAIGGQIPLKFIRQGLTNFVQNSGRLEFHDFGTFRLLVDYGHNIAGYENIIQTARKLTPVRLVGVIGVPGDRQNSTIQSLARVAGAGFDYLYIKEDHDLRGRRPGEVADLLYRGALEGGISPEYVEIVLDEGEALWKAMSEAQTGDLIVLFYEKLGPVLEIIQRFRNQMPAKADEPVDTEQILVAAGAAGQ